jgi:DNA-binding MarR family transcriptional regulator
MSLRAWLMARFRRPAERITIELDPLHQRILLFLHRFGDSGFRRILAELESVAAITQAEAVFALVKLEQDGLLNRASNRSDKGTVGIYQLTPRGRRIARVLPHELRSRIQFTV